MNRDKFFVYTSNDGSLNEAFASGPECPGTSPITCTLEESSGKRKLVYRCLSSAENLYRCGYIVTAGDLLVRNSVGRTDDVRSVSRRVCKCCLLYRKKKLINLGIKVFILEAGITCTVV